MKSIMKWLAGIFLACSLILSFFTPFEKALTLNLLLLYFFVKQFMDSRTYQCIFQVIYLLIFSGLIWFNLRHGDMIVIATALSWLTVVCELWLYSKHK